MTDWIELNKADGKPEGLRLDAVVEVIYRDHTAKGETKYRSHLQHASDINWQNKKIAAYRVTDIHPRRVSQESVPWTFTTGKWHRFPTGVYVELLFDDGVIVTNCLGNEVIWNQRGLLAYCIQEHESSDIRLRIPKGVDPNRKIEVRHKNGTTNVCPARRTHGWWDLKGTTDYRLVKR